MAQSAESVGQQNKRKKFDKRAWQNIENSYNEDILFLDDVIIESAYCKLEYQYK